MVLADSHGIPRVPCYSGFSNLAVPALQQSGATLQVLASLHSPIFFFEKKGPKFFDYWTFTICGAGFSCFVSNIMGLGISPNQKLGFPLPHFFSGLGCSRFARRYSGNRFCFLFLRLLRCFSSPGCLFLFYEFKKEFCFAEVALFGYLRIHACYQLPEAYRRYLRPSSSLSA